MHNRLVTITYPNGTTVQAIVLFHGEQRIRAMAPGGQDVLSFRLLQGVSFSDDLEPVTLAFEWQRGSVPSIPALAECICPKELAAKLVHMLHADDETETVKSPAPPVFTRKATGQWANLPGRQQAREHAS